MHSGATDEVTDGTTSVTIKHSALPVPGFQIENESIVLEGHSPHSRAELTSYIQGRIQDFLKARVHP